ncbi:G protein-coupled receptor 107 [Marchantia polymorpha subsp. ruderalis]|uniref:Intimal thickness related receptor IRP domain-containing protein n=2 Tax=Marchantia polymorpha TaxID=3197 RepID=A0AAF6B6Z0_MARPO|nr:hypothetical protein MARPO_0114s0018 [Marchantia polymorpha]BBN07774.1 hypothetical protein Mp_4g06350 [Marchantia polymorpha subsp. ruderalis]|eukprot:PTQ31198.1 hypothetical protein MARPO_0114s0018 [Marchantia polymorpha]
MAGRRMTLAGVVAVVLLALVSSCLAEIRQSEIRDDNRQMIMFEKFGFDRNGKINITVSNVQVTMDDASEADYDMLGFFLTTEEDLVAVLVETEEQMSQTCVLKNSQIKTLFTLKEVKLTETFTRSLSPPDANEYTLFFANCLRRSQVSMDVRTAMYNLEGKSNTPDYLPAGQTQLPKLFFSFFVIYVFLLGVWIYTCVKHRDTVHRIHILMGVLVFLKALNLVAEATEKSYIKKTGLAHGWDIAFYIFGFLRGVMLFTVIVLIGTGWSFLKPYLQEKEKKVLMVVIPLQVFANVASIVIDETGPSTKDWFTWKQVFLLLDIICCCAVLFPIVWSIKHLREASHTDGKAARNVVKLTLFRHYYMVVVSYIYFTRIVVFAVTTVTAYHYRWTSDLAEELASLAFYLFTGYKFRPVVHNPYFVLEEEEEQEILTQDQLKDDEFDL